MLLPASGAVFGQMFAQTLPLTMVRLVAPVLRTASYISCMPETRYVVFFQVTIPPSRQMASVRWCGSLYRSNATSGLLLYRAATCFQNVRAFASAPGTKPALPQGV